MGTHDLASHGARNFPRDSNGLNQYSSWTPAAINQDEGKAEGVRLGLF
jgi:hypothetical protein